jgi:hypothetical protein
MLNGVNARKPRSATPTNDCRPLYAKRKNN